MHTYTGFFVLVSIYIFEMSKNTGEEGYIYEFKFTLPMTILPQSFVGTYGSVKYFVETVLSSDRAVTLEEGNDKASAEQFRGYFTLRSILDLNTLPDIQTPAFLLKDNSGGLSSFFRKHKHPIRFTLNLSKRGFIPSEGLHFKIHINNGSSSSLHSTSIKLIQVIRLKIEIESKPNLASKTLTPIYFGESESVFQLSINSINVWEI